MIDFNTRYRLFADRIINMLTYNFIRGRRHVLWLQSLVFPLEMLNESTQKFFRDKALEARMTSQVMWFEWYLNYLFGEYFANPGDRITLQHYESLGVPIYYDNEQGRNPDKQESDPKPFVVYNDGETENPDPELQSQPLHHQNESFLKYTVSFEVKIPLLDSTKIKTNEFTAMIAFVIEKYRTAGKDYKLTYLT